MESIQVIKIGGVIINDHQALEATLSDIAYLSGPKILVHGGGKVADQWLSRLGIQPRMVAGRRITDDETIEVVAMTYAGLLNKRIVSQLHKLGCPAVGLSGADGNVIQAVKRIHPTIDFGWVGDIVSINATFLHALIEKGLMPVLCPITHDDDGHLLNTNADTIATRVSIALSDDYEVNLWLCLDLPGVLSDVSDKSTVVKTLDTASYQSMAAAGSISKGMIPKIDNALDALKEGVQKVYITHADSLKNLKEPTGTRICL